MYTFFRTFSNDPYYNLAFEEYILKNRPQDDIFILWQNSDCVVVGLNQITEEEVNLEYAKKNNIKIVRRNTGGGTVFHDLGNINYSFISDVGTPEELSIGKFSNIICSALKAFGLNATTSGRNDILLDGRKISGVAQRIYSGRILNHGTLLFDTDLEKLEEVLKTDKSKYSSKGSKSVSSRVMNIKSCFQNEVSISSFFQSLLNAVAEDGYTESFLSAEEQKEVESLAEKKYSSWEWNFGREPYYNYENSAACPSGKIQIKMNVRDGIIEHVSFFGDYMAKIDNAELAAGLKGIKRCREDIERIISLYDIESMFGGINKELIINLILDE